MRERKCIYKIKMVPWEIETLLFQIIIQAFHDGFQMLVRIF